MSDLIIVCGLPGSGKSTYIPLVKPAKRMSSVVSTDDIREEINGDARDQSNANKVFEIAFDRIKKKLTEGYDVYFDATNINYKKRMDIINRFRKYYDKVKCMFIYANFEECIERNRKRDRVVPYEVMKRMYYNFYVPQMFEGFDEIIFVNNSKKTHSIKELDIILDIDQENPHHKLKLLEHCKKANEYLERECPHNKTLQLAGYLHDIGKAKTKTYKNAKGEITDIAHYYNHEKVGAYDSLAYTEFLPFTKRLYIAQLIQWHMLLHNKNLTEKTIKKYKDRFGEDFWQDLELLHKADLSAH